MGALSPCKESMNRNTWMRKLQENLVAAMKYVAGLALGRVMCEMICALCVAEHSTKPCPCCVTVVTLAISPNSWSSGRIRQLGKEGTAVKVASPFC